MKMGIVNANVKLLLLLMVATIFEFWSKFWFCIKNQ